MIRRIFIEWVLPVLAGVPFVLFALAAAFERLLVYSHL